MKRKILSILLLLSMFTGGYVVAESVNGSFEGNPIVNIFNGGSLLYPTDVPAVIYHNRTMVPISLLNHLGLKTAWDAEKYAVTVTAPQYLTQDQLNTIAESVFEVHGYTNDPTIYEQGSGVVIDNMLITNYHVGGGASYVDVFIDGKAVRLSDVVFKDKSVDLMAFKITGQKSLKYSTAVTEVDDTVYDLGYPGGKFRITQGGIYNPSFTFQGITRIVHTAINNPGASGGALINNKGEVIAINKSNSGDTSDAIPIKYVQEEIDKLK